MARVRKIAAELANLLNSAAQPIYVLDDEQTLVFCNQACLEWVGRTAEEMHGRRCAYHSSPEAAGPDAVAAGLCPSPAVLAGEEASGTVACADREGRPRRRRARFIALGGRAETEVGVIALVDPSDLAEQDSSTPMPGEDESAWLHEEVRDFRRRMAARVRLDRLVGESPAMRRARAQAALAAQSDASVLIIGPPGSGRQQVAEAIHYGGRHESPGPLIPLACSVLGAELIRSTVAAMATRRPAAGEAGAILLNEADQLPLEVQAELAKAVSAKSFPLRLIATARQPLGELARGGSYLGELASLLSTIVIELPPLAQRRSDLGRLAQLLLEDCNARGTKQVAGYSSEALDRLDAYPWPGNVDELAQMVAEAHGRAEGAKIEVTDLPERVHLAGYAAAHPRRQEETIVLDEFLGRIERELIVRALARAKGNKTRAANLLGMTRPRLYRRLVQLGLAGRPPEEPDRKGRKGPEDSQATLDPSAFRMDRGDEDA